MVWGLQKKHLLYFGTGMHNQLQQRPMHVAVHATTLEHHKYLHAALGFAASLHAMNRMMVA